MGTETQITTASTNAKNIDRTKMVFIPGGKFMMGSDKFYPEEKPVHEVTVDGFWIDRYTVTNEEFKKFIDETGYVTVAERPLKAEDYPGAKPEMLVPGALVFKKAKAAVNLNDYFNWWEWMPGASWKHPKGPKTDLKGMEKHPVVHIAYEDAEAYANWAGKELPAEAEWEYAARGGLEGMDFTWGNEDTQQTKPMANTWQGVFPYQNLLIDKYEGTSPVGSFAPNGYGLYDMAGNVWEWCSDWYDADYYKSLRDGTANNPQGPARSYDPQEPAMQKRSLRGGSFLCNDSYCSGYRVSRRMKSSPDTGLEHTGFRCVKNK